MSLKYFKCLASEWRRHGLYLKVAAKLVNKQTVHWQRTDCLLGLAAAAKGGGPSIGLGSVAGFSL